MKVIIVLLLTVVPLKIKLCSCASRSPVISSVSNGTFVDSHSWARTSFSGLNTELSPGRYITKKSGITRLRPPLRLLRQRGKISGMVRKSGAAKNMVHFYIYPNFRNPLYHEEIVVGNNASLSSYRADFNPIILIQDYMQNFSIVYPHRTKDAYLNQKFNSNVIIVDWKGLASPKFGLINNIATRYPRISRKVSRIARQITDLLLYLSTQNLLHDPMSVHIVGFGLGAQVAGVVGNNFKRATGGLLGRITGLDPSGLQYHYTAMSEKLDKTDADFVDVYHTTTAPFGFGTSIGTVDFYPNGGGPSQPGCKSAVLDMMKDIPGMEGSCAHNRAWQYFTDSIYNKKLFACQSTSYLMYKMKSFCSKPVVFGQHISKRKFFLA
ncbi:pancreatic triacylglycerol lipase isoform X2 [Folsomia candida]|uniref:pancreatic triacylglycerol lipase isoform X2 n=1 Tax=Folsomia candida TaxID=158441 RepID=UPI000B907980|nr:pancreatic triacylglycerol lipase isoform X2 [Folsomia candida]